MNRLPAQKNKPKTKPMSESYPDAGDEEIILWESGPRPAVGGSDKSGESMQKVVD